MGRICFLLKIHEVQTHLVQILWLLMNARHIHPIAVMLRTLERTTRWLRRCKEAQEYRNAIPVRNHAGGMYKDLRYQSAMEIVEMIPVMHRWFERREPKELMCEVLAYCRLSSC